MARQNIVNGTSKVNGTSNRIKKFLITIVLVEVNISIFPIEGFISLIG